MRGGGLEDTGRGRRRICDISEDATNVADYGVVDNAGGSTFLDSKYGLLSFACSYASMKTSVAQLEHRMRLIRALERHRPSIINTVSTGSRP